MAIKVYPDADAFIGAPPVPREALRRRLSAVFDREIHDAGRDCEVELCGSAFPGDPDALRIVPKVLSTLRRGPPNGLCRQIESTKECHTTLQKVLSNLERDADTPSAVDFLQLLVALSRLEELIRDSASSIELGDALTDTHVRLARVRSGHAYFRDLLGSEMALATFLERNGLAEAGLSAEFLDSFEHYVAARQLFQAGEPAKALAELDQLKAVPDWFADFTGAFQSFGLVEASDGDLEVALRELDRFLAGDHGRTWLSFNFAGRIVQLTVKAAGDALTPPERAELLGTASSVYAEAVRLSRTTQDQLGSRIEWATALRALGELEEADGRLSAALGELEPHVGDVDYRMAIASAAVHHAARGDYPQFKRWTTYAVNVFPGALCELEKTALSAFEGESDASTWIGNLRIESGESCSTE